MPIVLQQRTFRAWFDGMPGPGARPKLTVIGQMDPTDAEVDFALVRAIPQSGERGDLLLAVQATEPAVAYRRALASHTLRYEERPALGEYSSVTIVSGESWFTIPVRIVLTGSNRGAASVGELRASARARVQPEP